MKHTVQEDVDDDDCDDDDDDKWMRMGINYKQKVAFFVRFGDFGCAVGPAWSNGVNWMFLDFRMATIFGCFVARNSLVVYDKSLNLGYVRQSLSHAHTDTRTQGQCTQKCIASINSKLLTPFLHKFICFLTLFSVHRARAPFFFFFSHSVFSWSTRKCHPPSVENYSSLSWNIWRIFRRTFCVPDESIRGDTNLGGREERKERKSRLEFEWAFFRVGFEQFFISKQWLELITNHNGKWMVASMESYGNI